MSALWDGMQRTICEYSDIGWKACEPWWESYVSPEALTNVFAAILGAVIGAIAGGIASYFVQKRAFAQQRHDREAEQRKLLQERLVTFVMTTQRILADMQNVQNLLTLYKRDHSNEYDLWQIVHNIHISPGLKADLSYLECLARLGSATLVTTSIHLYGEYTAVIDRITEYNALRFRYLEARRKNEHQEVDQMNMQHLAVFIDQTTREVIEEASTCQKLVFRHSETFFGSGEFLKLKNDELE